MRRLWSARAALDAGAHVLCEKPTAMNAAEAKAMLDKAVQSGKVSAQTVAELVFDAVRDNQFYIYSHPQALSADETRLKAIVNQTQPPDPFAERPQIGENLKQALRGG